MARQPCGLTDHYTKLSDLFLLKVDKNGPVHPVLGTRCWLWTGAKNDKGYGQIRVAGRPPRGKCLYAHIMSYENAIAGPIAAGLVTMHKCDVPACVNPDHLKEGTRLDNSRDMVAKGRCKPPPPRRKVTDEQVVEMRALWLAGSRQTAIARKFGIDGSQVSRLVNGMRR